MNGKRRNRQAPKTFGNIQARAEQCTTHMQTARSMDQRDPRNGLREAEGYLVACGWHPETAHNWLRPDPRGRFTA
jgi:hypothetical protein